MNDLAWSASASDQIVGYHVESAASADGPWAPLTIDPSPALGFRDLSPAVPGTTFYRVTATDGRGSVSDPAGPVSFTRDAPPLPASPVIPAEGAPLLVPESMPGGVEPESVLFFGNAEPDAEGGGLIFGVAEMAAMGGSGTGIGDLGTAAGGKAGSEGIDGATGTPSLFDEKSDATNDGAPDVLREEDPVVAARSREVDAVSSSLDSIGVLAVAVLAALSVFIRLRGSRRGQQLS